MEKLKDLLFSFLNFLLIFGVIAVVIAGLMRIGLLEMPPFIEKIFGTYDGSSDISSGNDNISILSGTSSYTIIKADMTPENVRKILDAVKPAKSYSHDLQYTVHSEGGKITKRVIITEDENFSCAYYVSDGAVTKQIVRDTNTTMVNTLKGNIVNTVTYPNGGFDFAEDTGVIITHKDFFEAADESGYTFSLAEDDDYSLMIINFKSSADGYTQLQNYTLNLDLGIVTEAHCYENETLIYSLTTNAVSRGINIDMTVPEGFIIFPDPRP